MYEMKPGGVAHVELTSSDMPATRKFLEAVFGWKFKKEEMPADMEYWTFDAGSGPGGGMMKAEAEMPPGTVNYILVESVTAAVKKIKAHGGKVMMDRTEIPKVGWFAFFEIPGGVRQAVFEPLPKAQP